MPVKQLKGFKKVSLQPGETKCVTLTLTANELYIFDTAQGRYRVPTGKYIVHVGGASDKLPLKAGFTLNPADELPDLQVVNIRTLPTFPKTGDQVQFVASVLNRGTAPTPIGKPVEVCFRVNGRCVATSSDIRDPIPAGGMALISSSELSAGTSPWLARAGSFQVTAEVDPHHIILETIEANNIGNRTWSTGLR
jgi:beta-glucosidase